MLPVGVASLLLFARYMKVEQRLFENAYIDGPYRTEWILLCEVFYFLLLSAMALACRRLRAFWLSVESLVWIGGALIFTSGLYNAVLFAPSVPISHYVVIASIRTSYPEAVSAVSAWPMGFGVGVAVSMSFIIIFRWTWIYTLAWPTIALFLSAVAALELEFAIARRSALDSFDNLTIVIVASFSLLASIAVACGECAPRTKYHLMVLIGAIAMTPYLWSQWWGLYQLIPSHDRGVRICFGYYLSALGYALALGGGIANAISLRRGSSRKVEDLARIWPAT